MMLRAWSDPNTAERLTPRVCCDMKHLYNPPLLPLAVFARSVLDPPEPPLPSALLLTNCPCCSQCAAPSLPLPRTSCPSHAFPPSQGPFCVGRIAHSTRHVCCLFTFMWRCEAGLCDALTPVIVSSKCKAVAPSCGQVFSWEFYSGTVVASILQVNTTDGVRGEGSRLLWPWETQPLYVGSPWARLSLVSCLSTITSSKVACPKQNDKKY